MNPAQGHRANAPLSRKGDRQSDASAPKKCLGYDTFGSLLPGRNYSSGSYRFGFQGQEKDDEVHGSAGTSISFEYRMHDPRVGRFLSIDPLAAKYPHNSPYAFSENRLVDAVELEGLESEVVHRLWNSRSREFTVISVTDWKEVERSVGENGPRGKGTLYRDHVYSNDGKVHRMGTWYSRSVGEVAKDFFTKGDWSGGGAGGDVEYVDMPPGQVMDPGDFGAFKGDNAEVSTQPGRDGVFTGASDPATGNDIPVRPVVTSNNNHTPADGEGDTILVRYTLTSYAKGLHGTERYTSNEEARVLRKDTVGDRIKGDPNTDVHSKQYQAK